MDAMCERTPLGVYWTTLNGAKDMGKVFIYRVTLFLCVPISARRLFEQFSLWIVPCRLYGGEQDAQGQSFGGLSAERHQLENTSAEKVARRAARIEDTKGRRY